jgi:hypothetical protein
VDTAFLFTSQALILTWLFEEYVWYVVYTGKFHTFMEPTVDLENSIFVLVCERRQRRFWMTYANGAHVVFHEQINVAEMLLSYCT